SMGVVSAAGSVPEQSDAFGFQQADDTPGEPPAPPTATSFGVPIADNLVTPTAPMNTTPTSELGPEPSDDDLPTPSPRRSPLAALARLIPAGSSHRPMILAVFVGGLLVFLLGMYLFLRFSSTAVVAIQLKTQPVSRESSLTLDPAAS